ncbi:MAG: polymer-forming cytoskeletal protein [Candidatus Atribacteria bacterium]|nr:polymer-forming cytoskeletal protein [Candidatus Atribacteria bacterium]
MNSFKDDKGTILITVVSLIAIITLIIGVGSTLVISGNKKVHSTSNKIQAHYIAEAGIEEVISNPFLINKVLKSINLFSHDPSNPTPTPSPPLVSLFDGSKTFPLSLENNKTGTYSVEGIVDPNSIIYSNGVPQEVKIDITSTGTLINSKNEPPISTKIINCRIKVDLVTFYGLGLEYAIASYNGIESDKVFIYLDPDSGSSGPANVYSNGDITIRGNIPGSVISNNGKVVIDNKAVISGDVIASNTIKLNNGVLVSGNVISTTSFVDINNNAEVKKDTIGYGVDNNKSVYLSNKSKVFNVYTKEGTTGLSQTNNSIITGTIAKISDTSYPSSYQIPAPNFPIIDEEIKNIWKTQAYSEGISYNDGYYLGIDQEETLKNTFINGNLILDNNSTLEISDGSVIYVTGYVQIENNAIVTGTGTIITEEHLIIKNNSMPTSISLVALSETTNSQLTNNSITTGAILIPYSTLTVSNNATIKGGLFAKSIPIIGNNAEIYFNPLYSQNLPPTQNTTEVLTLESWTEDEDILEN